MCVHLNYRPRSSPVRPINYNIYKRCFPPLPYRFRHANWCQKRADVFATMTMCFLFQKVAYYVRWRRLKICTQRKRKAYPALTRRASFPYTRFSWHGWRSMDGIIACWLAASVWRRQSHTFPGKTLAFIGWQNEKT